MKNFVLIILVFSGHVFADSKCDELGKNSIKIEIDGDSYISKPDTDSKYKKMLFPPKLYCKKHENEDAECKKWLSQNEFVENIVKPERVICSYEWRKQQQVSGQIINSGKLVIYVEK